MLSTTFFSKNHAFNWQSPVIAERDHSITAVTDLFYRQISVWHAVSEIDEDKEAMAAFGSTSAGASLGDILGAALAKKAKKATKADAEDKPAKKKTTKKAKADKAEKAEKADKAEEPKAE